MIAFTPIDSVFLDIDRQVFDMSTAGELWMMNGDTVVLRFLVATSGWNVESFEDDARIRLHIAEGGVDADGRDVDYAALFTASGAPTFTDVGFRQSADVDPIRYGRAVVKPWRKESSRLHRFDLEPIGAFTEPSGEGITFPFTFPAEFAA
jgi:hypothetical protein